MKTKRHRYAVQAARDCASQLLRARGLLALMLATYWERGDGAYPPNFIVSATKEVETLSDEELKAVGVVRKGDPGHWYYDTIRRV
jgi:hypothetical protein